MTYALKKPRVFHRWNHRHPAHRGFVRAANRTLQLLPMQIKYGISTRIKSRELPYSLVRPGDTIVQVGAPFDTLNSGRSRGFLLALAAKRGRALIIEPHPVSCAAYRGAGKRFQLANFEVHQVAVNSVDGAHVELLFDPSHPATNFVDGFADFTEEERQRYESMSVEGTTLDTLATNLDGQVKVLSITTNGAEQMILGTAPGLLARTDYVSLAPPDRELFDRLLAEHGFEFMSFDDRGVTYRHTQRTAKA